MNIIAVYDYRLLLGPSPQPKLSSGHFSPLYTTVISNLVLMTLFFPLSAGDIDLNFILVCLFVCLLFLHFLAKAQNLTLPSLTLLLFCFCLGWH